ncbi:hypothetical protein ACGFIJ_06520 [Microbispora bryophytorum]|uniref:hypothetical protein n=1 Tax=Microbispora bryophytorum TaxID=1460882 RepID=UPI00372422E1
MTEKAEATDEQPIDYEAVRRRFPWVGCGPAEEHDFSKTYRDVVANARVSREIIEAMRICTVPGNWSAAG